MHPLHPDLRQILRHGPPQVVRQRRQPAQDAATFVQLWQGLLGTLARVAAHDREWVCRQHTLNALLVVLCADCIVFPPDNRG